MEVFHEIDDFFSLSLLWQKHSCINTFRRHDWTNCSNLGMEPKYLAKSDVQLNPNFLRTKMIKGYCKKDQNNQWLTIELVYHVSNRILKKTQNLPLKFGYFHFSVSSSTFTTAFWQPIFVPAEPNQTILSTDISEPRFESHTEGKIKKTLKNNENFAVFC